MCVWTFNGVHPPGIPDASNMKLADDAGFEPTLNDSESLVLPDYTNHQYLKEIVLFIDVCKNASS